MNLIWLIYLANVLPSIGLAFNTFGALTIAGWVMLCGIRGVFYFHEEETPQALTRLSSVRVLLIGVALVLLSTFVPSERAIYLMIGTHLGSEVVATESAQEMLGQVQNIVMDRLSDLAADAAE